MDDENEMGDVADEFVIPTYPFVSSAALADALEMAAAIAEASAEFMRSYAERAKADHNHKVDVEDGIAQAAAEIESMTRPKFSDGEGA